MAYPAPPERVDDEQTRVGRVFPPGLRERLLTSNGGDLYIDDEQWTLYPVWDPTTKRTAGRSAGHIERATASLYGGLAEILPPGLVAVADNGDGDYLLLDPASRPVIWRHESGEFEPAEIDWQRDRPSPRRRSHRQEAIERVAETLTRLGRAEIDVAVVHAPRTEMYIQFRRVDDGVAGEAVGEQNLSKLTAYHVGPYLRERLPDLGWTAPQDADADAGNWTRAWSEATWDAPVVATLVVRTFEKAYGIEPWALQAYSNETSGPRRS